MRSRPRVANFPGAEHVITSDGFWDLETQPRHCLVVGTGYIGVELAGILAALGTKTTVMVRSGEVRFPAVFAATRQWQVLRSFDAMLRTEVTKEMEAAGITIVKHSTVRGVALIGWSHWRRSPR